MKLFVLILLVAIGWPLAISAQPKKPTQSPHTGTASLKRAGEVCAGVAFARLRAIRSARAASRLVAPNAVVPFRVVCGVKSFACVH
jgi:hypothetical protein